MIGDNFKFNNNGFSLIEMVVAVSIFIVVILMVTSIFQNSIVTQKNAIATQNIQEGMRYAMEVISKEMRSAVANINGSDQCQYAGRDLITDTDLDGLPFNKVYNFDKEDKVFYFRNREGYCVYYFVEDNVLKIERDTPSGPLTLPITPSNVKISNLDMKVETDIVNDFHKTQPNVTLVMDMESSLDDFNTLKLQTTISSRHYE